MTNGSRYCLTDEDHAELERLYTEYGYGTGSAGDAAIALHFKLRGRREALKQMNEVPVAPNRGPPSRTQLENEAYCYRFIRDNFAEEVLDALVGGEYDSRGDLKEQLDEWCGGIKSTDCRPNDGT